MQYSSINNCRRAAHYMSRIYSFYDWKFVPSDHFHLFHTPANPQALATTYMISASVHLVFVLFF